MPGQGFVRASNLLDLLLEAFDADSSAELKTFGQWIDYQVESGPFKAEAQEGRDVRLHYEARIVCRHTTCTEFATLDIDPFVLCMTGTVAEVERKAKEYAEREFKRLGWQLTEYELCPTHAVAAANHL